MKHIITLEDNIDLYLKIKDRKEEKINVEESEYIRKEIESFFEKNKYDYIFIPESNSYFLEKIAREYCKNVFVIYKKEFEEEDLLELMINIKKKDIEEEQKKSIIFKLLDLIEENKKKNEDIEELYRDKEEIKLSIHKFKSSQRKNIIEYVYDENAIQNILNVIDFNKEKSFCILDDFINSGETIKFLMNRLDSFSDYLKLESVAIFKQEKE